MGDIVKFGRKKPKGIKFGNKKLKGTGTGGSNPIRVIGMFTMFILISVSLIPFFLLLLMTIPFMPKKYWQILSPGIEQFQSDLMYFLREIEGGNK